MGNKGNKQAKGASKEEVFDLSKLDGEIAVLPTKQVDDAYVYRILKERWFKGWSFLEGLVLKRYLQNRGIEKIFTTVRMLDRTHVCMYYSQDSLHEWNRVITYQRFCGNVRAMIKEIEKSDEPYYILNLSLQYRFKNDDAGEKYEEQFRIGLAGESFSKSELIDLYRKFLPTNEDEPGSA